MIVHVPPTELRWQMWPKLRPLFEKVTRHTQGCYEPEDVWAEICRGEQALWLAFDEKRNEVDAVMTTALVDYPKRKSCRVIYVSGKNMKSWLPEFRETVERYAVKHGATLLQGNFRRGWARVWPGAAECGVSLYKELTA